MLKLKNTLRATLSAAAILAATAGPGRAQVTLGIDVPSVNNWIGGPATIGYAFDAVTDLYVTQLGYFDQGANGLLAAHDVGLWSTGGTLLASTTVAAGTSHTLNGLFRMAVLATPVTLTAGSRYVVGGTAGGDNWSISAYGAFTPHPDIAGVRGMYATPAALSRPVNLQHDVYFGGNFGTEALPITATPEPVSIMLIGSGLAGIAAVRRRRKGLST